MSDFSDRPFVAGSLIGLRAFDVDSLGRLRGVAVNAVFKPGENAAGCYRQRVTLSAQMSYMTQRLSAVLNGVAVDEDEPVPPPTSDHQVAGVKCTCGFYAYYDQGDNPHDGPQRVTALIEGYGVCSVGTRGFRAEKARLVGLVLPEPTWRHPAWFDRLADWCNRHEGAPPFLAIPAGILGIVAFAAGIGLAFDVSPWWAALSLLGPPLIFAAIALFKADFHAIDRKYPSVSDLTACSDTGRALSLVLRNYPDVPVYHSLSSALRKHPLTTPPTPTPDEPNFWTQAAS